MKIANFDLDRDGTYIIAELSANHNGSLNTALETMKAAKECGANAIKLQTYTANTMTLDSNKSDFIVKGGTLWDGKTLYELYKWASTPWEWHIKLFEYAHELQIDIFSTPFDKTAVDFLKQLKPPAYKIASFEISDYELIRYTASTMKPIIISTGIATIQEIQDAVDICHSEGNKNVALLQCTSSYPAPLEEANLKNISNLTETFNVVSGFSDHTLGSTAAISAVTLGAKIVEKHFILDKSIGGPDADFSMNPYEFKKMVQAIRDTEKLLGRVTYHKQTKDSSRQFTRSLYVSKNIATGEKFTRENIRSVRPGYGLHPKHLPEILGKTSTKNLEFGTSLQWEYIS